MNVAVVGNPNESPWEFAVMFFDARGQVVEAQRLRVAPGASAFAEVAVGDAEDFPADSMGRRTLRAEIVGFNPQPDPPGAYLATLEVFGKGGRGATEIFVGNPDIAPASE